MQDKTQQELETLLDLFEHKGWSLFLEDYESLRGYLKENAHLECDTNDIWQQRRGALTILDSVLSFEDTTKYVCDQIKEKSDEL